MIIILSFFLFLFLINNVACNNIAIIFEPVLLLFDENSVHSKEFIREAKQQPTKSKINNKA